MFRVSLLDLGAAFAAAIGYFEFAAINFGVLYLLMHFLSYHTGSDYYFKFEWMAEGNRNDPRWCHMKQEAGESCYGDRK